MNFQCYRFNCDFKGQGRFNSRKPTRRIICILPLGFSIEEKRPFLFLFLFVFDPALSIIFLGSLYLSLVILHHLVFFSSIFIS